MKGSVVSADANLLGIIMLIIAFVAFALWDKKRNKSDD